MSDLLKIKTEIDIESLAADFAAAGDAEQSKFFNIFFKALRVNCESQYRYEMQLTFIRNNMSGQAMAGCEYLAPLNK